MIRTRSAVVPPALLPSVLAVVLLSGMAPGCSSESAPQVGDRPSRSEREVLGPGRWRRRVVAPEMTMDAQQREAAARLEALGYAGGSQPGASGAAGVVRRDPDRASDGVNLYSDGHAAEAVLLRSDGEVLHRWKRSFFEAYPGSDRDPKLPGTQWWRHVELLPGGELLAIFGGQGLIKLDRDSRVLWTSPLRAHHQLQLLPDGSMYVLTHEAGLLPWTGLDEPVLEDFLTHLDAEGRLLGQLSIVEALRASPFRELLDDRTGNPADILHCNSLQVLDGRHVGLDPAFAAGNVLISSRNTSAMLVVEPSFSGGPGAGPGTGRVVWAHRGAFRTQHDAQLLPGGRLLLFDNNGLPGESRILELDSASLEMVWEYRGDDQDPFFSEWLGAVQRLPGGTTLVTDSNQGRAFEVTSQGDIVWEFITPASAGEHGEFIASISRMQRLRPELALDWLDKEVLEKQGLEK